MFDPTLYSFSVQCCEDQEDDLAAVQKELVVPAFCSLLTHRKNTRKENTQIWTSGHFADRFWHGPPEHISISIWL